MWLTNFPLFQTDIRLLHNFFLISICLEFNCISFVHHFLFNSCSALLCVLPNSNLGILQYVRTYTKCFVASTTFSHVCRLPTHPFAGLLVPCCVLLAVAFDGLPTHRFKNCNPKYYHLQDVSHSVSSLHLLASTAEIRRCGQSLPTETSRIHLMFNLAPSSEWFRPKWQQVLQCM